MKNKKMMWAFALLLALIVGLAACGGNNEEEVAPTEAPTQAPTQAPAPPPIDDPVAVVPDVFAWNSFAGRDPHNTPTYSAEGVNIWWDNWANLRASAEGDHVQIQFRPAAFDPEDFDDYDDYFARAFDWMGNWGEAVNMWAIDYIHFCRYLRITIRGAEGGEENRLLLHFQPNDGPVFMARFADLITREGEPVRITTDTQAIYIDLEASGFPGMTNRMHIRAFYEATIFLYAIDFVSPIEPIDAASNDSIHAGFTVEETGPILGAALQNFHNLARGVFVWNNFIGRDPHNNPGISTAGVNIWWDNWANMRASAEADSVRIEFRPGAFDPEDFDDYDDYFARAMDWMGNWGEAVNMWALDGITLARYLVITVRGAEGGEENSLLLHFQPEGGPLFMARFADLTARGGGAVEIADEMEEIWIDLAASGFPGMTNRMHIRAFGGCVIYLQEIRFEGAAGAFDADNPLETIGGQPLSGFYQVPVRQFVEEL